MKDSTISLVLQVIALYFLIYADIKHPRHSGL